MESISLSEARQSVARVNRLYSDDTSVAHYEDFMSNDAFAHRVSGLSCESRDLVLRASRGDGIGVCETICETITASCGDALNGLRLGVVIDVDDRRVQSSSCPDADVIVYLLPGASLDEGKQIAFVKSGVVDAETRRLLFLKLFMLDLADPNLALASMPHFMPEPRFETARRRASVDAFVRRNTVDARAKDGVFLTERRAFLFALFHHFRDESGTFTRASWKRLVEEAECVQADGKKEAWALHRAPKGMGPRAAPDTVRSSTGLPRENVSFNDFTGLLQALADKMFPHDKKVAARSSVRLETSEEKFEHLNMQHLRPLAERLGERLLEERKEEEAQREAQFCSEGALVPRRCARRPRCSWSTSRCSSLSTGATPTISTSISRMIAS